MKLIKQYDNMDCGPACLAMICSYYGVEHSLQSLREKCFITKDGVSFLGISQAAEKIGFDTFAAILSLHQLKSMEFPCILHWNDNHFVVLEKVIISEKHSKWSILDPGHGKITISEEKFKKDWIKNDEKGAALFLSPNEKFSTSKNNIIQKTSIKYLLRYFNTYKLKIITIFFLMLLGSIISFIFPFLSQYFVDKGVIEKNTNILKIIFFSQIMLFSGIIIMDIFRNWLMLYIGSRLSIDIISDYLMKLFKLPLKFFDSKMLSDFHQRIQDNNRIESFLTSQSLTTFFSMITSLFCIFVLGYYNINILFIYLFFTLVSILWSNFFLKKRELLDYYKFQQNSKNEQSIYEILNGITEIKLNNFEKFKIKEWKEIQENLFRINLKILRLNQSQLSGFEFFSQLTNHSVIFISAIFIVQGKMTLGTLLSISYIIGMMNSPINQLILFLRSLQDAKISLNRLKEIENYTPEEEIIDIKNLNYSSNKIDISFNNVSFQYEGPKSPKVLENITMKIPHGKITAIVGASGSGKTTLMKLILRIYDPTKGDIMFNDINSKNISPKNIRKNSGVLMQDGFIFSDSIERNIATGDISIDKDNLLKAVKIANIEEFINSLPLGYNTIIGSSGNGISGGQRQRILVARAVYKNPQFILFDEATSALDAESERTIHNNLQDFFKGKTVVVIAHRLSTVKNADNIIVLKKGKIIEQGDHQSLIKEKGEYFNLVKNQLELGT